MTINEMQERVVEEFAPLGEWIDKYEYLIAMGEQLPTMDSRLKTPQNAVSGCQSKLWIAAQLVDGKLLFHADSDSKITRGLIAVVLRVANNQPPEEVCTAQWYFLDAIGLSSNLSPSRANGLSSIMHRIGELAASYRNQGCG